MKVRKHVAKAMAFAMLLGMTAVATPAVKAVPVMAEEGATKEKAITIEMDYAGYSAYISSSAEDKYLFLEVLKDKTGTKVANTYCYPATGGEVYVDLSFLKAEKAQYIRAYGDVTTEKSDIKEISARPSKLKVKFTPTYKDGIVDVYSSFAISIGNSTVTLTSENIMEYLTRGANTVPMYATDMGILDGALDQMMIAGATLLISKNAVEDDAEKGTAGVPASAEVKVKIPAIPKAPKVTVDYVKGVVKFAKNAQIRLDYLATKDATKTTEQTKWVDLSSNSMTPEDILKAAGVTDADVIAANIQKGFKVIVRTKADGKKAASALTFVTIDGQIQAAQSKDTSDKLLNEITAKIDDDTTAKLTWTATETGATFKAEGADFQYVENGKAKKLAMGKEVKVKFTGKKTFTVSLAGLKSTKTTTGYFASNTVDIEVEQVYPAAAKPVAKTEGNVVTVTSGDLKLVFTRKTDTLLGASGDTGKFEYMLTGSSEYTQIDENVTVPMGEYALTIRVAKGEKNSVSEALSVTIPAYTAAE